jgi:hypothetical protein
MTVLPDFILELKSLFWKGSAWWIVGGLLGMTSYLANEKKYPWTLVPSNNRPGLTRQLGARHDRGTKRIRRNLIQPQQRNMELNPARDLKLS